MVAQYVAAVITCNRQSALSGPKIKLSADDAEAASLTTWNALATAVSK
jgi:hypothetical protein